MFARSRCLLLKGMLLTLVLSTDRDVSAELMGYYTFEKTADAKLVDSSGHGHHGIIRTSRTSDAPGIIGASRFGLDAGIGNARIVDGARLFDIAGANKSLTIAMWFQTPKFAMAGRNHLLQVGQGAGTLLRIVTTSQNGINRISIDNGRAAIHFNADKAGSSFLTGTWYHLAVTYNGSTTVAVYVNGMSVPSANGTARPWTTSPSTTDFCICTKPNGNESIFNGLIRDLGIWNEVLSHEKIALINGLGRVSGVGLKDQAIANVLRVFNTKTGTAKAGSQTWGYRTGSGSTTIGETGGTVADGNAFVVLDGSGNGVGLVIPEPATTRLFTHGVRGGNTESVSCRLPPVAALARAQGTRLPASSHTKACNARSNIM